MAFVDSEKIYKGVFFSMLTNGRIVCTKHIVYYAVKILSWSVFFYSVKGGGGDGLLFIHVITYILDKYAPNKIMSSYAVKIVQYDIVVIIYMWA